MDVRTFTTGAVTVTDAVWDAPFVEAVIIVEPSATEVKIPLLSIVPTPRSLLDHEICAPLISSPLASYALAVNLCFPFAGTSAEGGEIESVAASGSGTPETYQPLNSVG
nr:hypothetical protein [Methanofollis aquaemaris]